jgi:uncharacterized protein with PQ loop repeat
VIAANAVTLLLASMVLWLKIFDTRRTAA